MASLTQWTWVWVNFRSWWWTMRPSMLPFMGSRRVGNDWATELNWTELNVPLVSLIFLKRSVVFHILLFSSISLHWSLREAFLSLLAFVWKSVFKWVYLSFSPLPFASLLFSAICKASSDNYFAFLHFFFLGMVLITASYTMSWTSIHSSSGTLCIRSNPLNLFGSNPLNLFRGLEEVVKLK